MGHEPEIGRVILLAEDRLLPSVAALRDVVRMAGSNDSRQSGHDATLLLSHSCVKETGMVSRMAISVQSDGFRETIRPLETLYLRVTA